MGDQKIKKWWPYQKSVDLTTNTIHQFEDSNFYQPTALCSVGNAHVDTRPHVINKGGQALHLIQIQCSSLNSVDTHHYHTQFTPVGITDQETTTIFLKRFNYTKNQALI
jgi:hypothetical protein